jgi:hypothetical protein
MLFWEWAVYYIYIKEYNNKIKICYEIVIEQYYNIPPNNV